RMLTSSLAGGTHPTGAALANRRVYGDRSEPVRLIGEGGVERRRGLVGKPSHRTRVAIHCNSSRRVKRETGRPVGRPGLRLVYSAALASGASSSVFARGSRTWMVVLARSAGR